MKYSYFITVFLFGCFCFSQTATVQGTVSDSLTGNPVAFAEVVLAAAKTNDSTLLGAITNENGFFIFEKVPYGTYKFSAAFMGFGKVEKTITIQTKKTDLGTLYLSENAEDLEQVVVTSSKPGVQYKVDRQIINPQSFPGANVAVDLLKNVSSLQVDVNGEVTYRNDGTFKVYINGHPVPNGSQKLQQIPTEQIERIEVITNPSSEFSAEGSAGIIQIILEPV